ncbi:prolipoprotein diacylglyceryl transferase [Asticcacaulis sp. SL142]|uniref:prolipoprotein diacylglyceryl transferase n=1 Tax=Asticcacaulis sp. SL142 TaxID=2995155 RepID=UPI00226CE924|nr:prolipoprotein diacylglyceryl transferase [Asticcacaulis sp. SL142]WAC49090.1 prolipoprotein diacylglyceryl transferase [Asticcacaulis sp. SL142]
MSPVPLVLPDFDPVLLQIGPVAIRWYALAYVGGVLFGWMYAARLLKKEVLWPHDRAPITREQLEDLILWLFVGIILGGRIGYILFYDLGPVLANPIQALKVWEGGMSFHGGITGVAVAGILFARKYKLNAYSVGDLLACAAPIGLFLGRVANFINAELWGRATDAPWGMVFCNKHVLEAYGYCPAGPLPRHPSQLYEAVLEGLVLFAVAFVLAYIYKQLKRPGLIMGVFVAGYGIFRTIVEMFREPDEQMLPFFKNVITMGQSLSLIMVIIGGWLIWRALSGKTQTKTEDETT